MPDINIYFAIRGNYIVCNKQNKNDFYCVYYFNIRLYLLSIIYYLLSIV